MRRTLFAYLLILLLVQSWVDDAWAYTTVETVDDVMAAEDNEYLQPPRQPEPARPGECKPVLFAALNVAGSGLAVPYPAHGAARETRRSALPASLVYLRMSLRC
jgi:hypothetical protein